MATVGARSRLRAAEAYTGPGSAKITDLGFSYSARGEVTDTYEMTPHSAGTFGPYYHISASYWPNGLVNVLTPSFGSSAPVWTYTPDGEGRMYSVTTTAAGGETAQSSATYNSWGEVTNVSFGSSGSDSYVFDPGTGRMTQYQFNAVCGGSVTGNLSWNANGALKQLQITDPFSSADTQTCTNSYDDLLRLSSNNCGSAWSQSYSYDPFGNITMSGTTSFQPTYNAATNRFNTLPAGSPSYDANGNLTAYNGQPYGWDAEGKAAYTVSGCQNSFIYDALGRWVETAYQQNANCNIPAWDMAYAPNGDKFLISTMPGDIYAEQYLQLSGGVRALAYASGFYSGLVAADLHPDWLGSTRMQTDSGSASSDNAYAPFGQMYVGGANTGYQFAGGGEYLGIAGWSFPARNYLPDQGRWMSPDPAGVAAVDPTDPQTWNRYVYVRNNPLAQTDPSGTDPCNVFNVTYEGSGSTFPCDASVALGGPTASPTSIAGGPGVAVGSMIGYQPPELAEGMNTYLANVRGGGYCGGPACGWGWVAGDDPALILGFVGLKNANINPGTAVMTEALLQEPSCAGLFGGFGSETALSLITRSTIVTGITFPTSAYATTNPDTKTITLNVPNPSGNPLLPDYPSPYLNQNAGAAAQTIIHELLHVAVGAFGPSAVHMPSWAGYPGVWTQVDDPRLDPYASVHNQQLVTGACPVGQ